MPSRFFLFSLSNKFVFFSALQFNIEIYQKSSQFHHTVLIYLKNNYLVVNLLVDYFLGFFYQILIQMLNYYFQDSFYSK